MILVPSLAHASVKRCRGLNLYFKMENPKGHRIEDMLTGGNRQKTDADAIQALQQLFASTRVEALT